MKRDCLYLLSGSGFLCTQRVTGISRLLALLLLGHRTRDLRRNHVRHGIYVFDLCENKKVPPPQGRQLPRRRTGMDSSGSCP